MAPEAPPEGDAHAAVAEFVGLGALGVVGLILARRRAEVDVVARVRPVDDVHHRRVVRRRRKIRLGGRNRYIARRTRVVADDAFLPQADLFADRLQALGMQFDTPRFAWWRLRDANTVRALLAAAGLDEVEIHTQQMGYCLPNAEGWWEEL